jgi:ribonuclease HII
MGYIAGIDEAGRGPVLGPMVMAIVACEEQDVARLGRAGVADSKQLSPERRERLFSVVEGLPHEVIALSPREIDAAVDGKAGGDNLNRLEARTTALLILRLAKRAPFSKVIIDSPTRTTEKHERDIRDALAKLDPDGVTRNIALVCETKADENHTIVGAASILAKVTRDAAIRALEERHGPLGSGYPSDPQTQAFLGAHWQEGQDFFRKSWESYRRLAKQGAQSSLASFDETSGAEERSAEHARIVEAFEALKEHGFSFVAPTNQYEVVRMKDGAGVTVIRYTTGKLVVQGPDAARKSAEALIAKLGLAPAGVESKRPRGRPKKN